MNFFLTLAYLFFIGSVAGWGLEVVFRKFFSSSNPEHRWINPGFCTGPYLPLYGCGLCILFLLASLEDAPRAPDWMQKKWVLFLAMAAGMTAIEYVAGILSLKVGKVRLWDYRNQWGNIQGVICPLFSLFWAILGAVYYFLVHPYILGALDWLSRNLAFSFFIGLFFGVFLLDAAHSCHFAARLRQFATEHMVIVRYEQLKAHVQASARKKRFFFPFRSEKPLSEHLKDMLASLEKYKKA